MDVTTFSSLESQIRELITKGVNSYDKLVEESTLTEKTLQGVLEGLISKNIIKQTSDNKYIYQEKVEGDIVVLDGNILLPTTILRLEDKMLICRGMWYEFPLDFDVRRIVWNVKLESKTNSTLVDMIQASVLKQKKTKNVQLKEWEQIVDKVVPYSEDIGLLLRCVGAEVTDVEIQFKIPITPGSDISTVHRGFRLSSVVSTDELITELRKPIAERNFPENLKLNKIYNFSDFIFSKNEIPISFMDNELTYARITGVRKGFEITYYKMTMDGNPKKLDVESFEDSAEGINKMRELFNNYAASLLNKVGFMVEMTE